MAETDSWKSFNSVAEYSESDQNSSDDNENNTPVYHTLPFKVVGVAHSRKTQDHLEEALIKMKEAGGHVSAILKPEPSNEFDKEAIAVHIDYGNGPYFIGYIPRELTPYLHPLLKTGKITQVNIDII